MEEIDALISVPVLKDHDLAGVSIAMKNMYGAIFNPNKFHANHCDPFVADLCSHPLIRRKLRLAVCDASRVQVHNGPAYFPRYAWNSAACWSAATRWPWTSAAGRSSTRLRREMGLPTLAEAGREPSYIRTAARLGLGRAGVGPHPEDRPVKPPHRPHEPPRFILEAGAAALAAPLLLGQKQ